MSNWITPAGTIGQYTQQQPMSFLFQATTTLGGQIEYTVSPSTPLPQGLTLDKSTGVLSGSPDYVSVNTVTSFNISATEITINGDQFTNFRTFSITVTTLVWQTPAGNIGIFGENIPVSYQFTAIPSQSTNSVVYSLLNGSLPPGTPTPMILNSNGLLTGTPAETSRAETNSFTIRAFEYSGITLVGFRDRTFSMTVDLGITAPQFITPSGALFTINDSVWTNFQIGYVDLDPGTKSIITVVIGTLPVGLQINPDGLIRGYAEPPYNADGTPTTLTYDFTLQAKSESGISLSSYSITVVNQELVPGFIGRSPTLFNTRPPSFVIPEDDPYESYYLDSNSLGEYSEDNTFIFKLIGYDFDGINDLIYEVNGLESIGINNNQTTGWQNGQLPTIGADIETYNFTARVYKQSNPALTSETFLLSLTVIGDINTRIEWVTDSDLGTINNGSISDLSIFARSDEAVTLNYRIIGTEISSNLKTIVGTGAKFMTFGDQGAYVMGSSNGQNWVNEPSITESVTSLFFTDAVYNQFTENTILVGYNQVNNVVIGQLTSSNQFFPSSVIEPFPIRGIIQNGGLFVVVGDQGTIMTTLDPSSWTATQFSGTTNNLNSICYNSISNQYVVVGDQGTILTSNDSVNWVRQTSTTTINLRSVICSGARYVAVGDLGTILISSDGVNWSESPNLTLSINLKSVSIDNTGSKLIAVGDSGLILHSTDNGLNWTVVTNSISTTDLFGIYYDDIVTNSFYIVGSGGTILVYNNDQSSSSYETLTSPTLIQLPPDLLLLPTGEISGRLAFESTNQVVNQGVEQTYQFTVQAYSTEFEEINDSKLFTLTTNQEFYLPYDNIYIRALTGLDDRAKINELLNNNTIIPPDDLYRIDDPYFGKSNAVRYQHIFGVPSIATDDFYQQYINAVQINHYWRNITLGEIRTAVATDVNNETVYEVVYSLIQDDLVNSQGVSISKQITWPRNIPLNLNDWYTSRIDVFDSYTWFDQYPTVKKTVLSSTGTTITLNNLTGLSVNMNVTVPVGQTIANNSNGTPPTIVSLDAETNTIVLSTAQTLTGQTQLLFNDPVYTSLTPGVARVLYPNSLPNMRQQIYDAIGRVNSTNLLPRWMTSLQPDGTILGYTPAWVICYCKPGTGEQIRRNIERLWPYTLNQIDFQLDRFEVDRSKTYNYLGTNVSGVPLWNTLPSAQPNVIGNSQDSYIYFPRRTILPTASQ